MAEKYHNITVEEHHDIQIPGRLFELRDLIDDPDFSQVYMFGTTSYRGNFGNPCFCLGPADVDIKQIDIGGLIEENLHTFYDHGGTDEDVRQILGLVQEDEFSDESQLEYEEYSYVDMGWCIDGLIESFERIDMPEEKEQSLFSQVYLQMFEDENEVARIYAFDYRKDDLVWKAKFEDPVVALAVWEHCRKYCNTTLPLPDVESLSDNDTCRGADVFSWCIADTREVSEKNPYGIDFASYKQKGSAIFVREQEGPTSLTDRVSVAKEASQGLDNHGTKDAQHHDMDTR